jgi:CubicO group peptidase (beta-lactamase class C family)
MAIFAAADQGVVNLDAKIAKLVPAWRTESDKSEITLRNLLNQTSGLAPGYESIYSSSTKNKNQAALRQPSLSAPGVEFQYGPVHYESMEAYMDKRFGTGPSGPLTYVKMSILYPLRIFPGGWRYDHVDNPFFSAGAHMTSRDYLKIGRLVLDGGKIWGFFPLFSSKHLDEARQGTVANPMYGMGFWLNRNANGDPATERDVEECIDANLTRTQWSHTCMCNTAPSDLVAMVGSYGQRIYIIPSKKLVVVRTGTGREFHDPEFLRRLFAE